ncbi:hypothetical protein Taro_052169 [Colocasia esculenta]|uniref:Uncharacterized protein n=1 Tax=Colocasia esculenta TaxID=4460 RepID=A0A843XHW8_COLES|nr:hypothetical protein [Colocasia esculenta]
MISLERLQLVRGRQSRIRHIIRLTGLDNEGRYTFARLSPFSWDPHPREPVEGVLWATSVLELAAVLVDSRAEGRMVVGSGVESLCWFRSHVVVSGVGPQLDRAVVVRVWCVLYGGSLASLYRGGCRQELAAGELEVWTAPNCWFGNPFLGAIHGGTEVCSFLTSWCVRGRGWFCLWALNLVEVLGGRACGETFLLAWLLGVSCGDTWLFLPDLVEVWDVGASVVRLWSHVVAPVFRELFVSEGACRGVVCFRFSLEFLLVTPRRGISEREAVASKRVQSKY